MYDQLLQEKFDRAFLKIKSQLGKSEDINEAIQVIVDEKIFFHQHERAYAKIRMLEKLLNESGKVIPAELSYRKASIYLEFKNEYEKAEEIFLSLINSEGIDESLRDRCRFALCKSYLKESSIYSDDKSNELSSEKINKAKIQLSYLQERAYLKKLDDYVRRDLWELKTVISNIEINNKFAILNFPGGKEDRFPNREDALKNIDKPDILLDFVSRDNLINGNMADVSDDEMKLIYLLSKGTTSKIAQSILQVSEDTFFQRVKRLRKKLEKFGIKTLNRKYKLEPSVKVKVLYKRDEQDEIYYFLISYQDEHY